MPSDSSSGRPSLLERFRNLWELSSGKPEARPWSPAEAETTEVSGKPGASQAPPSAGREAEPIPWTPPELEPLSTRQRPTATPPPVAAPLGRAEAPSAPDPKPEAVLPRSAAPPSPASATKDRTGSTSRETADRGAQPAGTPGASAAIGQEPLDETPRRALRRRIGELLEQHPENAARLTRGLLIEDMQAEDIQEDAKGGQGRTKTAILMVAMGQESTAGVMKVLSDLEVEQIAQAISELDVVTTAQEDEVLEEFERLLMAGKYISQGGIDFARGALEKALGPRKAEQLLDRITRTVAGGFHLLRNVDPKHLVPFLAKEHPQTIALILSQLKADQAAGVLAELRPDIQVDVHVNGKLCFRGEVVTVGENFGVRITEIISSHAGQD